MDFLLRDALMTLVQDDVVAFGVAAEFVDSENKFVVFQRQYQKTQMTPAPERSANAARVAKELWDKCYTPAK
jgi:hypothetical protein